MAGSGPVPKKRYPKSRQGMRRSHLAIDVRPAPRCPHCASPKRQHHVCLACGMYRGRQVLYLDTQKE